MQYIYELCNVKSSAVQLTFLGAFNEDIQSYFPSPTIRINHAICSHVITYSNSFIKKQDIFLLMYMHARMLYLFVLGILRSKS